MTKFYQYTSSTNRIKEASIYCHVYNFDMTREKKTTSVLITGSSYQISTSWPSGYEHPRMDDYAKDGGPEAL